MRPSSSAPGKKPQPVCDPADVRGLLLPPDSHGTYVMAKSGTIPARKMAGEVTFLTSRRDELATRFDQIEINQRSTSAASEGADATMHTSTANEITTSVSLRLFTYPNKSRLGMKPLKEPRFAVGRKPVAVIPKTLSKDASKILRRPGQVAQRTHTDREHCARSRVFRKKFHPFSADAETSIATMMGMSDEKLARTQEELFASTGLRMTSEIFPLPAEVTASDEIGEQSQRLEVCSVGEDAAGSNPGCG
jgi:hypothetical protein